MVAIGGLAKMGSIGVVVFFVMFSICYNLYRFNKIEDELRDIKLLIAMLTAPELRGKLKEIKIVK